MTFQWDPGLMSLGLHFKTVIVQNEIKIVDFITLLIFRPAINDTLLRKKYSLETHLNGNYGQGKPNERRKVK